MENENFSDASSDSSSVISTISEFNENISSRSLKYEFVVGCRKNSNLLYTHEENQFYRFNSKNKNGDAYLCAEKSCKSRVHMMQDKTCIQQLKYFKHNHETKEQKYEDLKVLNIIKMKCADISTLMNSKPQSVRDIFYSVLSNHQNVKLSFYSFERTLQMIRNDSLPKNPISCDDISKMFQLPEISNLIGKTKDEKDFFNGVFESDDYAFAVFSSRTSIEIFESHEEYGSRVIFDYFSDYTSIILTMILYFYQ